MSLVLRLLPLLGGKVALYLGVLAVIAGWLVLQDRKLDDCTEQTLQLQESVREQGVVILRYQAGATAARHARDLLEYQNEQVQGQVDEQMRLNAQKAHELMGTNGLRGEASAMHWLQQQTESLRFEPPR